MLRGVLAANAALLVVELLGGLAFHSLALLADAAHLGSDVVGLSIALVAETLMARPASTSHSYGLQRAEVLGAQANALILVVTSAWVVFEAVRRIGHVGPINGAGVVAVAALGLLVNVLGAWAIARVQGRDLNLRGAFVHLAADAAGSVAAIGAGVAVLAFSARWVDPLVSMVIAVLVVWSAWSLLRETTRVLLEGTPRGLDPGVVAGAIAAEPGIAAVHHLHLWSLASDSTALSVHLVVAQDELSLHDAQQRGAAVRRMLAERFGIHHATVELECHPCDPVEGAAHAGRGDPPLV